MTEKQAFDCGVYSSVSDISPNYIKSEKITRAKLASNGGYSFKVAFSFAGDGKNTVLPVFFEIKSDIKSELINVYKISNVPVVNPVANNIKTGGF